MNRKPGAFPFVHSQIALLIFSLTVVGRPAYAEPNEAPAVLQFARKYQQEQIDTPRYKPAKKAPKPKRNVSSVPKKPVPAPVVNQALMTESERRQLFQLKGHVVQKEREIAAQSQTIQKLEKQLTTLKQAAEKASAAVAAVPAASPQDVKMVQNMIESLYRTFTLRPAPDALAENLKQANQRAADARLAEAAMQEKQKELKLQLDDLQNKTVVLKKNNAELHGVRETSLSARLEKLNKEKDRLESDLAASRQKSSQASAQVQQLEASMRKLENENKQYADDNKQLMLQISGHGSVSETLERVKKQQNKLEEELASRQQQLTDLENEKQQLQQQLAAAPTPAQLSDSQQQVIKLKNQLDAHAQLLQKQERSAAEQAKSSSEMLIAEKKSAEDKIKALQEKLAASQIQQAALESEQKQLQQKLQNNLLSKEANSAAIAVQLKELQDKLTTAQQQQTVLLADKEKLQRQIEHAPTPAQLADSQQKVKALQSELDASAIQLQKKEISTSQQVKASNVILLAEKQLADNTIKALQEKLDALQVQQTALLAEKQEFQQKLQSDLKGNEASHAALVMQLKELQGKLVSAQEQQSAIQSEKDKLQHQLDNAPGAAQLADSQLKIKALQGQLDTALMLQKKAVTTGGEAVKTDDSKLTAENKAAENKIKELQLKLDATQAELTEATKQNVSSKAKGLLEINSETLKKKSTREAYAIGVSLGTEILQLQAENRNWASTDSDKPSVLAGIIDSFQGKEKLPPAELHKALMNISERVKSGREKYMGDLDKSTKNFMANFTKQKNVKKSESGFWYRLGYTGDTPIPSGATIDVVVKESLANGMVIEDMDAKGIVLTQPISAFPPVFREALSKLKNHGSITIVVPPALAYGDKGYPPKVPPNATMVYDLRVSDVYPENAKK
ncbi:FKBP-type peptidyl-prolyl cis-trans isomerase [Erwinia sp. S43]|uniref:FKBP-type peptidyl-prolyl cis-trans isomerase N-terminal domain-containing protein n=1 Tax=Erwinia sp. S43 TaxID=2769339 RepID=UPI00190C42AF|nr:FKBP-type peptidyl-prolyl cis-trans isomerase N-terminal domain-containing protein [Erwinia sp. S43]MBK0033141.1 FKBP-type peptidyl-prolyl cis-trans isomerase [Erwinia sp. S43]